MQNVAVFANPDKNFYYFTPLLCWKFATTITKNEFIRIKNGRKKNSFFSLHFATTFMLYCVLMIFLLLLVVLPTTSTHQHIHTQFAYVYTTLSSQCFLICFASNSIDDCNGDGVCLNMSYFSM